MARTPRASDLSVRILHISTRLIIGGSQENTVLSCEGQAARGHEVHLAYGPIFGPEGSMLGRVEGFRTREGRSIVTHEVPDLVRDLSPLRDRRAEEQLRALIREVEPDVVHTHSSKAGVLGRMAGWREGGSAGRRGVVHTIHGPPFHTYEAAWRNAVYVAAERFAASRCHVIVSVADAMTAQFLARGIGRPEQYVTVRSGMDVSAFVHAGEGESRKEMRNRLGLTAEDFVIGTVARLAEHKGHDDILDALGEELRARPSWKLLWVGDGWWRERLSKRIDELGIHERVILTGLVEPERVPGLMRSMDVLVHPSYREGLPRTVPQALLAGTPVVAYDVDGTGEACIDGETGRLVAPGDVAGLREAVLWMGEDEARRERTVEAGRGMCERMFSAEAMVDGLERVYERACDARG